MKNFYSLTINFQQVKVLQVNDAYVNLQKYAFRSKLVILKIQSTMELGTVQKNCIKKKVYFVESTGELLLHFFEVNLFQSIIFAIEDGIQNEDESIKNY